MVSRRQLLQMSAGLFGVLVQDRLRAQEAWPARTITIVVPFPPGGTADFAGRPLAAHLAERLARNVVVENKGGAGGGIGHAYVARAEPDGYTLMIALPSLAVIPEANKLQGKPATYEIDQFVPLARMFADPPVLAVKKSSPWKTLEDFVTAVRNDPGRIPYGTSGYLGTVHLAMEMFLHAAGLKMRSTPAWGRPAPGPTAMRRTPARRLDTEHGRKGQFDAGNLRVLAQWGTERLPNFPDAPTFQQAGYPDVVYILWAGVFAPRKTPEHVTRILRDTIRPFMQDKAVVERFLTAGSQVSNLDGPEFARFLEGDTDRLVKVVRKIGLS